MAGEFDSAWLKWGWAVTHTQRLQQEMATELEDFQARHASAASTSYDSKRHCVILRVDSIDPLPSRLGLLLGDAANNFRASLDQIAWALVTTRPKRLMRRGEPSRVYFPVCLTPEAFDKHFVAEHLLRAGDRRTVRRYQPFWHTAQSRLHTKRNVSRHCLSVLIDVNRDDKHRTIRPVWTWPVSGKLFVADQPTDCVVTRIPHSARAVVLKEGAEIHRVYVRKTGPNPDVYFEVHMTAEPTIDGRVMLDDWIIQTTAHVRDLLLRFAPPPNELLTLGIIPSEPGKASPEATEARTQGDPRTHPGNRAT